VNFYTQTLLELILALGCAMMIGNIVAIIRRQRDRNEAREALRSSPRASRHATETLARNKVKEGTATLAVAPLGRSLVFVGIGFVVALWSALTLFA
jgi:hypothetical protein